MCTDNRRRLRPVVSSLLLIAFSAAVAIGVIYVLRRAWKFDSATFWSIAIPGVATGVGTIMLAAVTTWLSSTQRVREDRLRRDDNERREIEHQQTDMDKALREARKVIAYWRGGDSTDEIIIVVNAGAESIVEVHLVGARLDPVDKPGHHWLWRPVAVEDEFDRYHAPSWYCPFILPATVAEFEGRMVCYGPDGIATNDRAGATSLGRQTKVEVAWSDASGRHWKRIGQDEPIQLAIPHHPAIED